MYLRLGAALQKQLSGRSHCTPADLTKNTLIARLLEIGELTLVDAVFDVSVQMLAGDTFDVTMDNKDSKELALKHKIQEINKARVLIVRSCCLLMEQQRAKGARAKVLERARMWQIV